MHGDKKIGWNNEVVKRLTKDQLIAQHPHAKDEASAKWDEVHKDDEKPKKSDK